MMHRMQGGRWVVRPKAETSNNINFEVRFTVN